MTDFVVQRKRTGWDIVFGIVLVILGLVVLGNAVIATVVSVLFLGWLALIGGIVLFIASLFRIGKPGFGAAAVTGGLMFVLGLMIVRHPEAAVVTLTLIAGALFLASGIVRVIASFEMPEARWVLLISGGISVILGLMVLFDLFAASYVLIGILLGIQLLIDGLTTMLLGRVRVTAPEPSTS